MKHLVRRFHREINRGPRCALVWLVLGLCWLGGAPAAAQDESAAPLWIPSLSLGVGIHMQDVEGALASTLRSLPDSQNLVGAAGEQDLFFPLFPIGVQLKSSIFGRDPWVPRPFVHGGWQFTLDSKRSVANEGDPGVLVFPELRLDPNDVAGQGSRLTEDQKYQWFAGLGLAFPIVVLGKEVEVKPSVDYFGQLTEFGILIVDLSGPSGGPFLERRFDKTDSFLLHGLGPRIAIETEAHRAGPFVLSVFMDGNAYFFLSDTEWSETYMDGTEIVEARYETDPIIFQASVGLRLNWRGF